MLPDAIYIYPNADKDRFCRSQLKAFSIFYHYQLAAAASRAAGGRAAAADLALAKIAGKFGEEQCGENDGKSSASISRQNAAWRKR